MFTQDIRIGFRQCDPAGIIFFAEYFNYAQFVFEEFLYSAEFRKDYFWKDNYAMPLFDVSAKYHKPVFFNDMLEVQVSVGEIRQSSFSMQYKFLRNGELCAEVKCIHVFLDKSLWKKITLTDEFRVFLSKHLVK